jgi:hypothetical protein
MSSDPQASPAPAAGATGEPAKPRKSLWETILTATPIILTVIATLLAGTSSGEMTKAQYHRAVAAQNQSKVGDQWAFFQAKKIRGTTLEMAILNLRAAFGFVLVGRKDLLALSEGLVEDLKRAEQKAAALENHKGGEHDGAAALPKSAKGLREKLAEQRKQAEKLRGEMENALAKADKEKAFDYLNSNKLPVAKDEEAEGPKTKAVVQLRPTAVVPREAEKINPHIPEALKDVQARKLEGDMKGVLARVSPADLEKAIDMAQKRAVAFEDLSGPKEKAYGQIEGILRRQLALAQTFEREASNFRAAVMGGGKEGRAGPVAGAAAPPASTGQPGLPEAQGAVGELVNLASAASLAARQLTNGFTIAQLDYNFRRYDREARYNQAIASLYELQVRKSALTSDAHRRRSALFFYGMLAAQAGVTISTFALAVRQKSVLWSLASVAGLTALSIGAYVYFYIQT